MVIGQLRQTGEMASFIACMASCEIKPDRVIDQMHRDVEKQHKPRIEAQRCQIRAAQPCARVCSCEHHHVEIFATVTECRRYPFSGVRDACGVLIALLSEPDRTRALLQSALVLKASLLCFSSFAETFTACPITVSSSRSPSPTAPKTTGPDVAAMLTVRRDDGPDQSSNVSMIASMQRNVLAA